MIREPRAWQRMLSGKRLDLLNPSPADIAMEDIARGLARLARWNGQTAGAHPFSVAQHCLLVERIFDRTAEQAHPSGRLYALLHDAPEYVIGDVISPFKAVMGGDYRQVEKRLQDAIHKRMGLPRTAPDVRKAVKEADMTAAYLEAVKLAGFSAREADRLFKKPRGLKPDDFDLTPMSAAKAEKAFLRRLAAIEKAMGEEAKSASAKSKKAQSETP